MKFLKVIFALFLSVLLLGIGYLVFRKNKVVPKDIVIAELSLPDSKFIDWKGNQIHYIEAGNGPDVFMIHGLGGSVYDFVELFDKMKSDYHVIAVDLPGFSLSDSPDMSVYEDPDYLQEYADFINFFLKEKQLNQFHLIGNSMGGWISWEMAIVHPEKVKTLTLLNSAGYEMEKMAGKTLGWLNSPITKMILAKGVPNSITKMNLERCSFNNEKFVTEERIERRNMIGNKEGNLDWMKALALSNPQSDTTKIKTIKTPTLIVWGDSDEIVPTYHSEKFHRDIEGSKLLIYENCGHVPQIEMVDKLYDDLMEFYSLHPIMKPLMFNAQSLPLDTARIVEIN